MLGEQLIELPFGNVGVFAGRAHLGEKLSDPLAHLRGRQSHRPPNTSTHVFEFSGLDLTEPNTKATHDLAIATIRDAQRGRRSDPVTAGGAMVWCGVV